jgi:hypothetical protein
VRARAAKERTKRALEKIMVVAVTRRWSEGVEGVGEDDAGNKRWWKDSRFYMADTSCHNDGRAFKRED